MTDYAIVVFYSEEDGCWIANIPDLKYCSAHGKTPKEAFDEVLIAKELSLDVMREKGFPIPEPKFKPESYKVAS